MLNTWVDAGQVPAEKQPDMILLENGPHSTLKDLYFQGKTELCDAHPQCLKAKHQRAQDSLWSESTHVGRPQMSFPAEFETNQLSHL